MDPTRYHDATKHHFRRFARSAGHLDWATQPDPFRRFDGAPTLPLTPVPADSCEPSVPYDALFVPGTVPPAPLDGRRVSEFFRFSLGLSAWKHYGANSWALRVNPSSGNLHPTEGYAILGPVAGLSDEPSVFHYAPEAHALERRCAFPLPAWHRVCVDLPAGTFLAALASIHWREAWKYGERAYRYCQHDVGHAIAALSVSAAMLGWQVTVLPDWSDEALAAVLGLEREQDFAGAEREEPDCLMLVSPTLVKPAHWPGESAALVDAVRSGRWAGRANRLSVGHVDWPIIEEVAAATRRPASAPTRPSARDVAALESDGGDSTGRAQVATESDRAGAGSDALLASELAPRAGHSGPSIRESSGEAAASRLAEARRLDSAVVPVAARPDARRIILQRRSAQTYDGVSDTSLESFVRMLRRTMPTQAPPWDALWWRPAVHLALFVHRVRDLEPGLYVLVRRQEALDDLRAAMRPEFAWVRPAGVPDDLSLFLLEGGACDELAAKLSCGQDIAGDSFFSLGMIAEFERSLAEHGPWFYRRLFWETGVIGQVLYLEAEAAGARGTGIGCFFDDPVHDMLGLRNRAYQSLYHFTVGMPLDDRRLTTRPGYAWESGA